jgi:hypothetical protein
MMIYAILPKRELHITKRKILVSCAGRLGDTVRIIPAMLTASQQYDITMITTPDNDEVVRPFFRTVLVRTKIRQTTLDNVFGKAITDISAFARLCGWWFESRLSGKDYEYDAFFVLSDQTETWGYALPRSRYVMGHRRYWVSLFDRVVGAGGREFAPLGLDIDENSDACMQLVIKRMHETVVNVVIPKVKEPYVVVNVGCKPYRNLGLETWAKILDSLGRYAEREGVLIVLMDNRENDTLEKLLPLMKRQSCFRIMRETLSLWQGYKMTENALLYVGMDIGPSHLFQVPTNAVMIFTTGDHKVWRSPAAGWKGAAEANGNIFEEGTSAGFIKAVMYKESPCRPHEEAVRCPNCTGLDADFAADTIKKILKEALDAQLQKS